MRAGQAGHRIDVSGAAAEDRETLHHRSGPRLRSAEPGEPGAYFQRLVRFGRDHLAMTITATGQSEPARLLVVDDEQPILELLSGSLRFAGYGAVTSANGQEAVRAAACSRPDPILPGGTMA